MLRMPGDPGGQAVHSCLWAVLGPRFPALLSCSTPSTESCSGPSRAWPARWPRRPPSPLDPGWLGSVGQPWGRGGPPPTQPQLRAEPCSPPPTPSQHACESPLVLTQPPLSGQQDTGPSPGSWVRTKKKGKSRCGLHSACSRDLSLCTHQCCTDSNKNHSGGVDVLSRGGWAPAFPVPQA